MAIRYEAYTWSGKKVKGVLEANNEEDAYELLQQDQLVPYRLSPVRRRRSLVEAAPGLFKPGPQVVIDFTTQLSSLIKSGIPLRRALTIQRDQTANLGLKTALRQIIEDVEAGDRFSDAISRHPTVFSELYIRLLKVGEATGGISFTLDQLADNLQRRKSVTERVRKALTYPAISLALTLVASLVLVKYSLPSLVDLLDEFGGELPLATRMLMGVSGFMAAYVTYALLGFLAVVALAIAYMRTPTGTRVRDALLLKAPVAGNIMMSSNMFILTSTFVTLLDAGVSPIEALRLTEQGLVNVILRERLRATTELASQGTKLGEAFGQNDFPSLLTQALLIGEIRGTQSDTLRGLSSYYEQQADNAIGIAMELVQPIVISLVASLVGFVAIAVVSGIYSTLNTIE